MGACSAASRVGGLGTPLLTTWLGAAFPELPASVFVVLSLLSALLAYLLSEDSQGRGQVKNSQENSYELVEVIGDEDEE